MGNIVDAWGAGYRLAETLGWKLVFALSAVALLVFAHRVRGRGWF